MNNDDENIAQHYVVYLQTIKHDKKVHTLNLYLEWTLKVMYYFTHDSNIYSLYLKSTSMDITDKHYIYYTINRTQ